jgi:FAD/FMN-containing dehydrogenase
MTSPVKSSLEHQLKALLPRGRVLISPAQLAGYGADGLGYKNHLPDAVVIPSDAEELAGFMRGAKVAGGAGGHARGGHIAFGWTGGSAGWGDRSHIGVEEDSGDQYGGLLV